MKRYLGLVLGVAVALIAISRVYSSSKERVREAEQSATFARLQRDYHERVGLLRANPDAQVFRDEVGAFFRWYFGEVDAYRKRYGIKGDFDGYLRDLEQRSAGKSRDEQVELRKTYFAEVKAVFDAMRGGYRPLFTASDKGMRLDLLAGSVKPVDGHPRVVLPVVLWGAQRQEREEDRVRKVVASATFDAQLRLLDARGKQIAEMPISGGPDMRVEYPERFIPEFPPQMVLGRYELPLVPADVARLEAVITVSSTPAYGGRPVQARYEWKLDVPAEWKLRPGEAWEGAEVVERSEEELGAAE
jgi:hypothetical protein